LRGDIIVVARGGHTPTAAINVNKRGITIVAENYGGNRQNMDEHWVIADAGFTDGPVLEITQGCKIIGLTFVSRFTTGPSVRATADSIASGTPNAFYVEMIECIFPGWGVGYDGFEFRGASLGALRRCTFTALANSGAGVAFRGSASNNPVQNVVEECLFLNLVDGVRTRSGTPQDNWFHSNRFMDCSGSCIHTNGGAGNGMMSDNHYDVANTAGNAYDLSLADVKTNGWAPSGEHYLQT
jgi:hypothetical protein